MRDVDTPLRVLIGDQNAFYRGLVRQYLVPFQLADMTEAETSAETISHLVMRPFDLLVADWEMLIANDGALLECVNRRARVARRKMPVLATMAKTTRDNIQRASAQGVNMVLRKPFTAAALTERARWLLERVEQAPVVEDVAI